MAVGVAEAEIYDLDVFVVIEEEVFRLEVSMDDVQLVDILDASVDLLEKLACLVFLQTSVRNNVVKELTAARVLHDQVELLGCLDDLIELDDVRVPDQLQNVDLPSHTFYVRHIRDAVLLQDLDCHLHNTMK